LSLAALSNKEMGLSHERVAPSLPLGYGLTVSRSGICRALERWETWPLPPDGLACGTGPLNGLDDTGWRVGGKLQNLRVIGNEWVTVYRIEPHRALPKPQRYWVGPITMVSWCMTELGPGTGFCRLFTKPAWRI
jgi:hypothetical protein